MSSDIQALFQEGLRAHQAGRLADAEAAYRQILGLDENHADTNHLLGVIAHQVGDHEASVELISKAIQASPSAPAYHCNLGNALYELGRLDEAAASQRQAIALNPDYAMAHNNLGNVLLAQGHRDEAAANYQKAVNLNPDDAQAHLKLGDILNVQGRWEEAAGSYHKALALVPDNAEALTNLGNILTSLGRPQDAAASYQKAIALKPDLAEAHNNLGTALLALGRPEDAATSHRKAITLKPDYADAHTNLGNALKALDQLDDAAESHEQAIALNPDLAEAHSNLGGIRQEQNRFDEAAESCREALALNSGHVEAHANLGSVLYYQDRLEEGEAACRRAIELKPDYPQAHVNLSLFLFRKWHLEEAWNEFEWRWRLPKDAIFARAFPQPRWNGSPLEGKSILLWGEQGIGDLVRLAGMIPDVLKAGAAVTIVCDERVVDLFTHSFDGACVFAYSYMEKNSDRYDFQCPFGSLGKFFRSERNAFPSGEGGYLKADPERLAFWKTRLLDISDRPKVGLSWSGPLIEPGRECDYATIEEMAPVLSIDGLEFINLQSHDGSADIEQAKILYGTDIHTFDDIDLRNDLDEAAALTASLDLVISFATFGAEFAGTLGVPTFCFSPRAWAEFCSDSDTGNSVWLPDIRYVTKSLEEPWRNALDEIGRITRKKFSL